VRLPPDIDWASSSRILATFIVLDMLSIVYHMYTNLSMHNSFRLKNSSINKRVFIIRLVTVEDEKESFSGLMNRNSLEAVI